MSRKIVKGEVVLEALGLSNDPAGRMHLARLRMGRKIPYIKYGHRTIRYDLAAVLEAVRRFEVQSV
jgi:hypothetical protein